jgi:MFS family permease
MLFYFSPTYLLNYFLKREATQFFTSVAIRKLALGMVLIFEPIYLYLYFGKSLSLTILFFAAIHGLYGFLVVFGGKIMTRIGLKHAMLFSHFFFWGYYLALFFLPQTFWLIPLAILLRGGGMTLYWPSFYTDFCRFSEKNHQSREVGKLNVAVFAPAIISPFLGGWILTVFDYPVLFTVVLVILFTSAIPLFLSRDIHEVYSDSYRQAWKRIFKRSNRKISLAMIANSLESGINFYLWPLFMAVLAISYSGMGGIITFALAISALFALYMGRISTQIINRIEFLNIGSFLTATAWIIKYFVVNPFDAFLAHSLYRICRTSAGIPFQTLYYEKASFKGEELDEFIISQEIVTNLSRSFFFVLLAGFFFFIPQINLVFLAAAAISLGFMFMGIPPKFRLKLWH